MRRAALFLDRDGVLIVDKGYVGRSDDVDWMPGAIDAVHFANDLGYLVIVVTNQSGIGRGLYTESDFNSVTESMMRDLRESGAHFDAVYFCPHHPTEGIGGYRVECECRKPKPGMVIQAIKEWGIDAKGSVMIGDSGRDLQAAESAGVRGVLFERGNLLDVVKRELERALKDQ